LARVRQHRAVAFLVVLTALFLGLSLLAHDPRLAEEDRHVTLWLQAFRTPALDRVAVAVTHLGDFGWLAAVTAGMAALLLCAGRRWAALLGVGTLLVFPLNSMLKEWVDRPRPGADVVEVLLPALGLSFPSGHAMSAAVVYGFLGLMAWLHLARPVARWLGLLASAFLAALVGLSRVYLGVHWFSDVLGGWTAGLLLLLLLAMLYRRLTRPEPRPPDIAGCER
jgi:undecaprenyl-diphosphatase